MAGVSPLLNRVIAVLLRHALNRREGVTLLPPIVFLLVCGITLVAKDMLIVFRIISVPAVHNAANALCRLSTSIAGHIPSLPMPSASGFWLYTTEPNCFCPAPQREKVAVANG